MCSGRPKRRPFAHARPGLRRLFRDCPPSPFPAHAPRARGIVPRGQGRKTAGASCHRHPGLDDFVAFERIESVQTSCEEPYESLPSALGKAVARRPPLTVRARPVRAHRASRKDLLMKPTLRCDARVHSFPDDHFAPTALRRRSEAGIPPRRFLANRSDSAISMFHICSGLSRRFSDDSKSRTHPACLGRAREAR